MRGAEEPEIGEDASEEEDAVLESLEDFFPEEQVNTQKKKKPKKLKENKASKVKRKKEDIGHFCGETGEFVYD
ncbi:UNVERIFIED_CONTAM: hypothetical protein K2H54_018586 [Gekko kuhli]